MANYYNPYNDPYQRRSFGSVLKNFFSSGSALSILIIINVGVWLLIAIVGVIGWLMGAGSGRIDAVALDILAVPAYLPTLLTRLWTLITYMFFHLDFWHILFNMLWLYWFGKIFLEFLSEKQLLSVYIWGGVFGALLYILCYNIFPAFQASLYLSRALGASAAVMAIVGAVSFYAPNYTLNLLLIGRVRLIYFALAYLLIDLLSIRHGNAGGHISHLGGALFGILYAYNLRKGFIRTGSIGRFFRNLFSKRQKPSKNQRPMSDEAYNLKKRADQEEIDRILDKISKHGYDALSKKEKETLFKRQN